MSHDHYDNHNYADVRIDDEYRRRLHNKRSAGAVWVGDERIAYRGRKFNLLMIHRIRTAGIPPETIELYRPDMMLGFTCSYRQLADYFGIPEAEARQMIEDHREEWNKGMAKASKALLRKLRKGKSSSPKKSPSTRCAGCGGVIISRLCSCGTAHPEYDPHAPNMKYISECDADCEGLT